MEVEYKVEKSQEEREQSVLPLQALGSLPCRCCVMGLLSLSVRLIEALHALFQRLAGKSHPILQGMNFEIRALKSRAWESPGLLRAGHSHNCSLGASPSPGT